MNTENTKQESARKPYHTPAQIDLIASNISDRDRQILDDIERLVVLTGAQIRRLRFAADDSGRSGGQLARRALLRLTRMDLLERSTRRIGGNTRGSEGFSYYLAPDGQRLQRRSRGEPELRGRRLIEPGLRTLEHRLAISELYVRLFELATRSPDIDLMSFCVEPVCWRPYVGSSVTEQTLKPDAFVALNVGDLELSWFIEMDRGTVTQRTREQQAAQYLQYWRSGAAGAVMPRVLWITKTDAVAAKARASLQLPHAPDGLFEIVTEDVAADRAVEVPR